MMNLFRMFKDSDDDSVVEICKEFFHHFEFFIFIFECILYKSYIKPSPEREKKNEAHRLKVQQNKNRPQQERSVAAVFMVPGIYPVNNNNFNIFNTVRGLRTYSSIKKLTVDRNRPVTSDPLGLRYMSSIDGRCLWYCHLQWHPMFPPSLYADPNGRRQYEEWKRIANTDIKNIDFFYSESQHEATTAMKKSDLKKL